MPRRLHLEVELPDEVLTHVRDEEIALKAKEALVMELLREHHISQGQAAECGVFTVMISLISWGNTASRRLI